jgi:hypothetical protein
MQTVSRFEASLLRLLYFFLKREPAERALLLVDQRLEPPPCLNRSAVKLVEDALAKGCTFLLAERGGWRDERHLRGERIVSGRLWERTAPNELALSFSPHTLEFLIWITARRPGDREPYWGPPEEQLTDGDRLFLFFAHEGLREGADSLGAPALRTRQPYNAHGLCRLTYPEDFTDVSDEARPNFGPWTTGVGLCILEALQPFLVERWIHVESQKEQRITDPEQMLALGRSQERVLTAFLDALEKVDRLDLSRFLLRAAARLLQPGADLSLWIGALQTGSLRLADRAAIYQAAVAFLRQLPRLQGWARRARAIGYFDEGYQAAQLWKEDWEHYDGDGLCARAQQIVRQTDLMRPAAGGASG